MDRFHGMTEQEQQEQHDLNAAEEAAYQAFLLERQRWEQDEAAIREYESWILAVAIAEGDAEGISAK